MGVSSGEQVEPCPPPWIFKHGTNIVDRGLKVLFFGLPPGKFFADAHVSCLFAHSFSYIALNVAEKLFYDSFYVL